MSAPEVRLLSGLHPIPAQDWNRLAQDNPFLSHQFLSALHDTGCASPRTGWTPRFLTLWRDGTLAGALPLYLKTHSYGEYVFDWAWADAYHRHGACYYPKLLSAVPFTPATGPRLMAATPADRERLAAAALELARAWGASSWHCLFPTEPEAGELQASGLMLRQGIQFQWENPGYGSFDDFLGALNREKRKKIKQERRRVREAGIGFQWLTGRDIGDAHWEFFTRCYNLTYRQHLSTPYLTLEFFRRLGQTMPDNLVLMLALRDGAPVAAALDVVSRTTLYGRYWGSVEFHPGLHFEACYYQAIEFCIARGLQRFEGGAQGEHKMARGLLPRRTWSAHWLAHPEFAAAVGSYLDREARGITHYLDELSERNPFKP